MFYNFPCLGLLEDQGSLGRLFLVSTSHTNAICFITK